MTNGKLPKPRPLGQPDQRLVFWFVGRQRYSLLCNLLSLSKAVFTCDVRPLCLLFCFCYGRGESSLWLASEAHFDERVVKSSGRSMDFEKIPQHSLLEFSWCVSDLFQTHDLEIAAKLGSDRDFMQTLKSKAWDILLYKLWLSLSSSCMTFTGHCFMSFKYGKQCLAYLTYSINYWSLELSGKWNWLSPI